MKELFGKIFKKMRAELFTIPNMLSIFRLLLIPFIVYAYVALKNSILTVVLIAISSLSDVVDGFIARKFNMITDFGKFLDPLADKVTQLTVIACLITRFKLMIIPCIVLFLKEIGAFLIRLQVYSRTEQVDSAKWHGKASTVLLVLMMATHLILPDVILYRSESTDIMNIVSVVSVTVCTLFMIFSSTMYTLDCLRALKDNEN